MKELSFTLFKNQELLSILVTILCAGFFLFGLFYFLPFQKNRKKEFFSITFLICAYAILSFWNLGTTHFPKTWWQPQSDHESIIFEITDETTKFDTLYILGGGGDNNALETGYQVGLNNLEVYGSDDLENWTLLATLNNQSQYLSWITSSGTWDFRYISMNVPSFKTVIHEFGIKEEGNDQFLNLSLYEYSNPENSYSPLAIIDEQATIPFTPTSYNSSYFDEIYHARNAWEIANNQDMYASVHPLLGTTLMSFGIRIFGMNPLGWRFMGALFGVLILPLFYLLAKALFKKWSTAFFCTSLLAADFMLISTSRIGTLEPFSIFFILLMTYFMVLYLQTPLTKNFKKQLFYLALCGISMGLAISTKWTGVYAAIGLAILFFTHFFYQAKFLTKDNSVLTADQLEIKENFKTNGWKIILWCIMFFIIIPFLIYCFSFYFTRVWKNDTWSINNVINHSIGMYNYHATLNATHPFQSTWYQWIFDIRPIWYFIQREANDVAYSISCFNNPLISWVGIISVVFTFVVTLKTKSINGFIIIVSYLAALIPWMLVDRCVFAYHYYPALPFLILAIGFASNKLEKKYPKARIVSLSFLVLVWIVFLLFLPALTGAATTSSYLRFLQWLPSWSFGG